MFHDCKYLLYPQSLRNISFQVTWEVNFISRHIDDRSHEFRTFVVVTTVALSLITIAIGIVVSIITVTVPVTVAIAVVLIVVISIIFITV